MLSNTIHQLSLRTLFLIVSIISAFAFTACASSPYKQSTGDAVSDSMVTSRVKSALLSDNLVSGTDVSVETYGGKVMLSGYVDAKNQIERAVEIAKGIEGVKQVVNKLEIKPNQMGQTSSSGRTGTSESQDR
jgi:hypothetical protein